MTKETRPILNFKPPAHLFWTVEIWTFFRPSSLGNSSFTQSSLSRCRHRHVSPRTHVLIERVDLLLAVTIVIVCQRAFPVLEIRRHFGLRIDGQRVAHPAEEIGLEQTRTCETKVYPFTLEYLECRQVV